ncbi:3646_t:CDS:2 [Diversispora eburnea]|uniref:3646_t:CDS:1 n=1 Tax=Diversispora eburnea TaxID=1213867 RepID=A0A9N9BMS1_9GLOM|nr:3646_t:CDS:2 [Diversispora eburnea]
MSQKIEKIKYCPAGHSSEDFAYSDCPNFIFSDGKCALCTKEYFIQEFKTWSKLENGIKWNWNFIKQDWEYDLIGYDVALKEIKDSRYDIVEFLKVIMIVQNYVFAKYYGISKNPSTQNYIIVMELYDDDLNKFLTKKFWDLKWLSKIDMLSSISEGLGALHQNNLVYCGLHSGMDNNVTRQLKIADENQKNTSKSQKQELFELFSHSNKLHPQSCYISRNIYTLHGLHDLLEEIKSGKSSDPNILTSNESTTLNANAYDMIYQ